MAIYNQFTIKNDFNCSVCTYPIKKGESAVAHAGKGRQHPLHFRCAECAYLKLSKCPSCREEVCFSFKDRSLIELKCIGKNALEGLMNVSLSIFEPFKHVAPERESRQAIENELMTETASPWNVRGHFTLDQFIVQAHRGVGDLAEENTLDAFQLGWKLGCIAEADLRMTKDGVIVAFHDNDFSRVIKDIPADMKTKGVKDITFEQLQKLDVGSWKGENFTGRHVSRITEIFALMQDKPDRRLYLDIKNVDLAQLVCEVRQYDVTKQVILASTKYDLIRNWKSLVPESSTLLWMGGTEEELNKRFEELRNAHFADITQLQIHTHLPDGVKTFRRDAVNPFKESDAFLMACGEEIRSHGILFQTLPYGGSTPEVYWKLLDLGLMSFATDHPDVTWNAVRRYYQER